MLEKGISAEFRKQRYHVRLQGAVPGYTGTAQALSRARKNN